MPKPNLWTTPIVGPDGLVTPPWKLFFQSLDAANSTGSPGVTANGPLSAYQLVAANSLGQIRTLGARGLATQTLHGNPDGLPTWGSVRLGSDVSGNLPVENLDSGTNASDTTWWRGDGEWHEVVGDPTAQIGFVAVPGTEATAVRSDGAPALATTLVTPDAENFSLSTADDPGDDTQRGNITLKSGDSATFLGCQIQLNGAGPAASGNLALDVGRTFQVSAESIEMSSSNWNFALSSSGVDLSTADTLDMAFSTAGGVGFTAGDWTFYLGPDAGIESSGSGDIYLTAGNGITIQAPAGIAFTGGSLQVLTAGSGIDIAEGTDARMGLATLSSGTATVATAAVGTSSRVFAFAQNSGSISAPAALEISGRIDGTSFDISSADPADDRDVAWLIINPV